MDKVYILEGRPTAWSRAGYNKATESFYDTQKMKRIHDQLSLTNQHGNNPLLDGPLALYITFYMPIPDSILARKRARLEGTYHHKRPDTDNLEKWILDLCSHVIFKDDAQVALTSKKKIYSSTPCTIFTFIELK